MKKRAIFLDRDGTLIEEKVYLSRPEGVVVVPGTGKALRSLREAGFLLFIVTNQSGIGRGYYTEEDMKKVNARLCEILQGEGVEFDGIYYAPEAPEQPSRGRKPSPEFLQDARDAHEVALEDSYMIGDKMSDLECGWNAGVKKSILVRTGYGPKVEEEGSSELSRAWVVEDLLAAANRILVEEQAS